MKKAFWSYAVDGSGVHLRTPVAVLASDDESKESRVRVVNPTDEVRKVLRSFGLLGFPWSNEDGTVDVTLPMDVLSIDRYPAVESFGWMD